MTRIEEGDLNFLKVFIRKNSSQLSRQKSKSEIKIFCFGTTFDDSLISVLNFIRQEKIQIVFSILFLFFKFKLHIEMLFPLLE